MAFSARQTCSRNRRAWALLCSTLLGSLSVSHGLGASQVFAYGRVRPEKGHLIENVPFERWLARNFCGPACLATVFRHWRGAGAPGQAEIAGIAYHPEEDISFNSDLVYFARLSGMASFSFSGDMQTLKSLLADDIPVIVLTSMIKQLRKGHYRVIIGFDEARKQMIFHDPYFGPRRAMSYADFERNWNLGEDRNTKGWALAIVPEESRIRSARVRNDPLTQINLAAAYYRRGEYSRAALEWRAAGEKMAGDPAPLYSLGMIHLRAKDYDLAAEYARQAIRVDPRCAAGHDVLGLALHQKGEIREALASLGRALRLDRKSDYVRKHYLQVRDSYISWSKTPREGRKTQEEAPR